MNIFKGLLIINSWCVEFGVDLWQCVLGLGFWFKDFELTHAMYISIGPIYFIVSRSPEYINKRFNEKI